ncbi:MAG: hypothetical protein ACYSWW_14180 [Planctomycetota bacterium]|jgi:hypothetical protein
MKRLMLLVGMGLLLASQAYADYSLPAVRARYLLLVRPISIEKAKDETSLGRIVFVLPHDAKLDSDESHHDKETRIVLPINKMFMQDRIWSDGICVGVSEGPKSAASRVEAVRKDLEANRLYANSTADKTRSLLIEICDLEGNTRIISYIQFLEAAVEFPKYQKNWKRFDVQYDTIDFVPPLLPETPGEFETLLRQRCRLDRDRLLRLQRIISPEAIRQVLTRLDVWKHNNTPDHKAYLRLVSEMRILFRPGNRLAKETIAWLNGQHRYSSATSWEGRYAWWLMDVRNKGYMVILRTDLEGAIDWLFTDVPPRATKYTLHPDQLRLFLQIRDIRGFHGLRFKGHALFPQGRILPASMRKICEKYLKDDTYTFYSASSAHGAAHVFLKVEKGIVKQFEAMEAHFAPMKTQKE